MGFSLFVVLATAPHPAAATFSPFYGEKGFVALTAPFIGLLPASGEKVPAGR
jgi:hypothetical protein